MKKFFAALSFFICICGFSANAQEAEELVHYAVPKMNSEPQIKKLDAAEDDLYDGADIKPLSGQLSQSEKLQENSSDLDYIDNSVEMPELPCSDARLLQEVRDFVFKNVHHHSATSVLEKRSRTLLIKNMHEFEEITEKELEKNFEANAALMYLKINENREIYKICASRNNRHGDLQNIYLIIYPYINYYKVVVTNLIVVPEKMENATFLHNW